MIARAYVIGIALGAAAIVVAAVGLTLAINPDRENVTGPEALAASAAALEHTGGGEVTEVEIDPEDGAVWEVDVTRPDGVAVDVRMDNAFKLVAIEIEDDEEDEHGG